MKRRDFLRATAGAILAADVDGQWLKTPASVAMDSTGNVADLTDIYSNVSKHYDLNRRNVTLHIKLAGGKVWDIDTDTIEWLQKTASKHVARYNFLPVSLIMNDSPFVGIRALIDADKQNPRKIIRQRILFSTPILKVLTREQTDAMIAHEIDGHLSSIMDGSDRKMTPLEREVNADCKGAKVTSPELLKSAIDAAEAYNVKVHQTQRGLGTNPGHDLLQRDSALDRLKKEPMRSCTVR